MPGYPFGGGCPDPASLPAAELAAAAQRILPRVQDDLARYPDRLGWLPLREVAAQRFYDREGVPLPVESIVLTSGSQQGITLACQALLGPGKPVIVEEFTYPGTLRAMRHVGARIVGVPTDQAGMRIDRLAAILAELSERGDLPGFIYTTPTYQNPTGATLSAARRRELLTVARQYGVPVVDDNCYADLDYAGPPPPSLKALDPEGEVILFESFSKIVGPGLRSGYFSAPEPLRERLLAHKIDAGTSILTAAILAEYLRDHLWEHVGRLREIGRRKRDAMLAAFAEHLGDRCSWQVPDGGYFLWVRLPHGCDVARVHAAARARGIVYGDGRAFHYADAEVPYFRFSFAYPTEAQIAEGVAVMAECIEQAMAAPV